MIKIDVFGRLRAVLKTPRPRLVFLSWELDEQQTTRRMIENLKPREETG